ncbi:MAG: metal-dependent hydrolase [Erysipelotrichaceae bacterium]|nr:metal-dependent hydrolase [Erysipelotrichaceae bacterium]
MKIKFHGHACFELTSGNTTILIDPYISGNPLCQVKAEDLHPDAVLVSHGHGDHLGDALSICKANRAAFVAIVDMVGQLSDAGLMKSIPSVGFSLGGTVEVGDFKIRMVPAWHGTRINCINGYALPVGFVISDGETTVYFAGDTALFGDMEKVIARYGIDVALLPVGGYYTMDIEDAAVAAAWLKTKTIIPMHYDTFPQIRTDLDKFKELVAKECDAKVLVLDPEEEREF